MSEDTRIRDLKELLLNEDRATVDSLKFEIEKLRKIIETEKLLDEKVGPIIDDYLETYTDKIPDTLGPAITASLKSEIANSKDAVVDALYPIMGKMIKKYIQKEFELLSEKINTQIKQQFSFGAFKRKFKSRVTGVKEDSLIIKELSESTIVEIFIIDNQSGLLKGNYSKSKTIDKDVLSAMLTAIKSFVNEALKRGNDDLESIEFGLYNIHIQNFKTYYIAVVVHGVFDTEFQESLRGQINDYASKHYDERLNSKILSKSLENHFN